MFANVSDRIQAHWDKDPSIAVDPSGTAWVVWTAFHDAQDEFLTGAERRRVYGKIDCTLKYIQALRKRAYDHRIVVFPGDDPPIFRYIDPNAYYRRQFNRIADREGAFVFAHHGAWRMLPSKHTRGRGALLRLVDLRRQLRHHTRLPGPRLQARLLECE